MRTTKRLVRGAAVTAGAIGAVAVAAPGTPLGRGARRLGNRLARDFRYATASAPGIIYRLNGRSPDPDVSDDVLADRIRSSLGPIEKHLDVPRVHVMVQDHVAVLHGDVPSEIVADRLEVAVLRVSGVQGVESHLHVGLIRGDTRPSSGRERATPSEALNVLLEAARAAGAGDPHMALHAVLCTFVERIPEGEREQLLGQLPTDVRAMAGPPRRHGTAHDRLRSVPQFVSEVVAKDVEPEVADAVVHAVITTLRTLVPHEAHDVAAVLPTELRALWQGQPTE
jgi:uncharacterized protein (DUF2267 family)